MKIHGRYKPSQEIQSGAFTERAGLILGYIQVVGMIVAVIGIAIIGLKYMFSSVEGKAEYKKTMMPYIVGCFMLMGTSIVIGIIKSVATVETTAPVEVALMQVQRFIL